jgi:hypothetical protein
MSTPSPATPFEARAAQTAKRKAQQSTLGSFFSKAAAVDPSQAAPAPRQGRKPGAVAANQTAAAPSTRGRAITAHPHALVSTPMIPLSLVVDKLGPHSLHGKSGPNFESTVQDLEDLIEALDQDIQNQEDLRGGIGNALPFLWL